MNAIHKTRVGLVVVAAGLIVFQTSGVATGGGIGIGFGGVGISVGRGGHRGHGPGHRVQSAKKHFRGGAASRVTPRLQQGRAPAPSNRSLANSSPAPAASSKVTKTKTAKVPVASSATATAAAAKKPASPPTTAPPVAPKLPLELVDLRLIDIGNVEAGQGPRFRIQLKNATTEALKKPLEVLLSAGISSDFRAELPTGVQEIKPLGAGEVATVELRLPAESMKMTYPGAQEKQPFSTLFVLIGGPKNLLGSSSISELKVLTLDKVRMADIVVAAPVDKTVAIGELLQLTGEGFGPKTGSVKLKVAGVAWNLEVVDWNELGVQVRMPELALTEPTKVQLQVLRSDGQPANMLTLTAVLPDLSAVAAAEQVPFPSETERDDLEQPMTAESVAQAAAAEAEAEQDDASDAAAPQQPLSLAQVFGGLGLPPSDSKE